MSDGAVPISCAKATIIGAYELDGDKSSKELLIVNEDCKTLVKKRKILPDVYSYLTNLEIRSYDPETGKYGKTSVIYSLLGKKEFAQDVVAVDSRNGVEYSLAKDAVIVEDLNNDGLPDLIVKTCDVTNKRIEQQEQEDKFDYKQMSNYQMTVLYNNGKGQFSPKKP